MQIAAANSYFTAPLHPLPYIDFFPVLALFFIFILKHMTL
jgi:hypothetical protein